MPSEIKIAGAWAAYAVGLMLTSAAAYVFFPASPPPKLALSVEPESFARADRVTIRARLGSPALRPIAIDLDLGGDALIGQDYEVAESGQNTLRIAIGERDSTPLVLRKRPFSAAPDRGEPRTESSQIVATAKVPEDAGIELDRATVEIPIEVTRLGPPPPPYIVTVQGSEDAFNDRADKVTIEFRLDRPVTSPTSLAYRLGGTARQATDYSVTGQSGEGRVQFAPGQASARIVLERRPAAQSRLGLGDRDIEVSFAPGPRFATGSVTAWKVRVPDPKAELTWSVEPAGTLDAGKASELKVRLSLTAPRKDPVSLEYRATADGDVDLKGPPGAADGPRTLRIEPGQLSAEHAYQVAGTDKVGGPAPPVRFEPRAITPPDVKEPEKLGTLDVALVDDRPLAGQMLVVLVWNDDMARSGKAVLDELAAFARLRGDKLVGGTVLILAADRSLSQAAALDPQALKAFKPFPADADPDAPSWKRP
ncbi:MAG: hypothetical protein U0800_06870 [Isosphaeraceae bacterium]